MRAPGAFFLATLLAALLAAACAGAPAGLSPAGGPPAGESAALESAVRDLLDRRLEPHPGATVAVAVRDPATGTRADIRSDRVFHAASTMKVAVLIELFRQAEAGKLSLDDRVAIENEFLSIVDGTPYAIADDSDEEIYGMLGEEMTVRQLAERMIRVSSNLATNLLIELIDPRSAQATIERLGTREMKVLRGVEDLKAYERGLNNVTTAADLATLLLAILRGEAGSPEATREMIALLESERFNEMILAGLPPGSRVAHKTGTITGIHHDAAIVYPPAGEPYVLVVLTEGIADEKESARLGAGIAATVHRALRAGAAEKGGGRR